MKPEPKPGGKTALSPDPKTLAADWAAGLPAGADKAGDLASRLQPYSAEEREMFFAFLLDEAGESAWPLFEALRGKDAALDAALARGCGQGVSPRAIDFLVGWARKNPSKIIVKEIRRSLFRLKSKGMPVPDLEDDSPGVFSPPRVEPPEGHLSAVDAGGSRAVWLALPQLPHGMLFASAVLQDEEGILNFAAYESSRRKFQEFMERTRSDSPWDIVECDPAYCAALIHEAHEIQVKQGNSPNPEYLKSKGLWGPPPASPPRPLIYRHLDEAEFKGRSDLVDRSPSLFQKSSFQLWLLGKEEMAKGLTLLEEAGRSRIILAPHQQEARFFEIYRQTVRELFDAKRRLLFRRRLEEMAYILWKKGDEDGAKIALASALALAAEDKLLSPHPFLLELVKRTVFFLREETRVEKEKEKGGGLIFQP